MIELLLYIGLSCSQAESIIKNVDKLHLDKNFTAANVQEVIEVVKESTPECFNERPEQYPGLRK